MLASARRKKRSFPKSTKFSLPKLDLSLLISLAFHGLFFVAIFPRLSLSENGLNGNNDVSNTPVIELNAIEQTRLPNLNPPNFFNWDGVSPLPQPNNNVGNVPLPQTNMYPRNDFNPNPNFQFPLINNNNSIVNLPPPPTIPNNSIYRPNYSLNANLPQPVTLPPPPPLDASAIADLPPDFMGDTENVITIEPNAEAETDTPRELTPLESPSAENTQPNPQPVETAINSPPSVKDNEENTSESESTVAVTSPPIQPSYEKLSESLQAETENTSNEQAVRNDVQWRAEVKVGKPKLMNISATYPRDACIRKLEGTATYGVTVNPDGKVTGTKLIKSSGYPLFNNEAVRQIQARSFNNTTGATQAYHVYIDFKYNPDVCPSLSLDNLGKIPPQPTATPPKVEKSTPKTIKPETNPSSPQPNPKPTNNVEVEVKTPVEKPPTPVTPSVKPTPAKTEVKTTPTPEPIKPLPPIESTNEELPPIKPLPPIESTNEELPPIKPLPPLEGE